MDCGLCCFANQQMLKNKLIGEIILLMKEVEQDNGVPSHTKEKIVNGIDVETLEEIMTSYKEFRESGGDRDDTIDVIVNTVRAKRGEA